jgi:hypothetical protein
MQICGRAGLALAVAVVWLTSSCGRRSVDLADLGDDHLRPGDAGSVPGDAPAACQTLTLAAQTQLAPGATLSRPGDIVFDGEKFAVLWMRQNPMTVGLQADLLLTRVDRNANAENPDGMWLADADYQAARLADRPSEYGVLYMTSTHTVNSLRFLRLSKKDLSVEQPHGYLSTLLNFDIAPQPAGFGMIVEVLDSINYNDLTTGSQATIYNGKGESLSTTWLAPRADGYAAAFGDNFALLDAHGFVIGAPVKTGAASLLSRVYAATPAGHAMAYARSTAQQFQLEAQILDSAGVPAGSPQPVGSMDLAAAPTRQIALVSTGKLLFVVYAAAGALGPSSQLVVQQLGASGGPVGPAFPVPPCLATSSPPPMAAWGGDTLAVAHEGRAAGASSSALCVTMMRCAP